MGKKELILYVDESGIHKSAEHSSFAFVYVQVDDREFVQSEIIKIEKSLEIAHFHWSHLSTSKGWNTRRKFIEKTLRLPFSFKYTVVNNPIVVLNELHDALFVIIGDDVITEIYIDGKQPVWVARQLKKSLRDRGFSIRRVLHVDDVDEPIIRLADALANVIRIYHNKPTPVVIELFRLIMKKHRG